MAQVSLPITPEHERSRWLRLRTLVWLRWAAIIGQTGAIVVADQVLGLQIDTGLGFLVIGLAIVANVLAIFVFPETTQLSDGRATAMLLFDITQLCLLLYISGGLNNPFALLVLAPVAVGATSLQPRSIVLVVAVSLSLITLVTFFYQPLVMQGGLILRMPDIFILGFWFAIFVGVIFVAALIRFISEETHAMWDAVMATQMALEREQKLTDLGGVVAAAAHELGTPLATIKLVSSELAETLEEGTEQHDDALLLGQQADRCRDILRSMGRTGKDDLHMHRAPISAVVEEAAEPHVARGKHVHFNAEPLDRLGRPQPIIRRVPAMIHGIRNLVQNAVDFAEENVWVDIRWDEKRLIITIADDGAGYPTHLIGRIGDPFMRRRARKSEKRPEYEGMGLGLFIAKTLLERTGAELTFANGSDPFLTPAETPVRKGAVVEVLWMRADLEADGATDAIGENTRLAP